ncbi:Spore coat protein A domain protein, partial [delta proteobacterium NaphS2]
MEMMSRKKLLGLVFGFSALLLVLSSAGMSFASVLVPQTHYPGVFIDKYQDPLPVFNGSRVDAATTPNQTIRYREFRQRILPDSFYVFSPTLASFDGTLLWGYDIDGDGLDLVPGSSDPSRVMADTGDVLYPGNTFIARRGTATEFTYYNELPRGIGLPDAANDQTNYLQRLLTIDQTLHFANPFEIDITNAEQTGNPFLGPQPVITHLHGAEVPSTVDGGPDQWFTPLMDPSDNTSALQGAGYYGGGAVDSNSAVFQYPNDQEATTLWYHDHALGLTRINVYAGLAGYYWLRDPGTIDDGSGAAGGLPAGPYELEFVIQDRMFDDTGELLFPDGLPFFMPQPPHLFWNPEFLGDTIVVNGKSWPYVDVGARRYRVRFLNGSN